MRLWPGLALGPGLGEAPLGFLLDKTQVTVQGPELANGCALVRAPRGLRPQDSDINHS